MYNYHLSLGGVFNIIDNAADNAKPINQSYDLSLIKDSASDELFHYDHFHIIMDLKDCGKFLSNKEASAVTVALKLLKRADKAWNAALIDLNNC